MRVYIDFTFFLVKKRVCTRHVTSSDGEAKFWIEPNVALGTSHGLSQRRLKEIEKMVLAHEDEIRLAWRTYFAS